MKKITKIFQILSIISIIIGISLAYYSSFKYFNVIRYSVIINHYDECIIRPMIFFILGLAFMFISKLISKGKWQNIC